MQLYIIIARLNDWHNNDIYIPGRGGSSLRIVTEAYAGETTRAPGAADRNTSICSGPSGNTSSTKDINTSKKLTPAARMSSLVSGMKSSPTVYGKIDKIWLNYTLCDYIYLELH